MLRSAWSAAFNKNLMEDTEDFEEAAPFDGDADLVNAAAQPNNVDVSVLIEDLAAGQAQLADQCLDIADQCRVNAALLQNLVGLVTDVGDRQTQFENLLNKTVAKRKESSKKEDIWWKGDAKLEAYENDTSRTRQDYNRRNNRSLSLSLSLCLDLSLSLSLSLSIYLSRSFLLLSRLAPASQRTRPTSSTATTLSESRLSTAMPS